MDKIFGILKVDYPELSDDQHRQIQLGELDVLPDGKKVAEYAQQVEALKDAHLAAEAAERAAFLKSLLPVEPKPQDKSKPPAPVDQPKLKEEKKNEE